MILDGRDPEEFKKHVAVQAGIEIGFERFLEEKNYQAIVTHFGDLGALQQLPGLAIQRLMAKGYGFGAEGDWKTAAMVRLMKIMTAGMKDAKGTSFMEDYTYNLNVIVWRDAWVAFSANALYAEQAGALCKRCRT